MKLRPEINDWKYWLHLVLITLIVYVLINSFATPMAITVKNVLMGSVFIGISDIVVHTVLQLD